MAAKQPTAKIKPPVIGHESGEPEPNAIVRRGRRVRDALAWIALSLILVMAACLRFHDLGSKAYHLDEALTVSLMDTSKPFLSQVLRATQMVMNDVPGEFVIHYWVQKWRHDEFGHRFPAAVFGSLSVILIFLWTAGVWGRIGGLAAAVLLAVSAWHIGISRETMRPTYMLYVFTFAMAWSHRTAALQGGSARWIRFAAITAVGLMFHVFVVIPLALCGCCAGIDFLQRWKGQSLRTALRYVLIFAAAGLAALIPLAIFMHFQGIAHDSLRYSPTPINWATIWRVLSPATGSTASEGGTATWRCFAVFGLAAVGVVSLCMVPHRRRELGYLASVVILLLYFYQASKGTKYFATRHSAFFHPFVLFAAAGGVAQLGDWLGKLWARLPVRSVSPLAVKAAIAAAVVGVLAAANRNEIRRYYVYGLAYHFVPNRALALFVRDNILPNEDLYCEQWYYWFFKAYAPELNARLVGPSEKDLATGRPYWYAGAPSGYKREGFTEASFAPSGWAMGYCCPAARYDAAAFADRLKPSGASQLDSLVLGMVSDKGKFIGNMLIKANSLRDRKERADALALGAGYFRKEASLPPWRLTMAAMLSERSAALDPFNRYTLGFAALDALNVENYVLAVRLARQSIAEGETLNPVSVLQSVARRTNGTVFRYQALLRQIVKATANARRQPPEAAYTKRQLDALASARAETLIDMDKAANAKSSNKRR